MQFVKERINFMDESDESEELGIDEIAKTRSIEVEVAYALPEKQELITLLVKKGTTALAAVLASGLTTKYPQINNKEAKMGIFSKLLDGKHLPLPNEYKLEQKDRVEVYRPLLIGPKQARMEKVTKARKESAKEIAKAKEEHKVELRKKRAK